MLEGLVAQILNERELVINIGSNNGVTKGKRFAVLATTPIEIHDPQTGELLDTVDRPKVRVEATEVRDKVTICSTYEVTVVGMDISGLLAFSQAIGPRQEIPKTLKLKDSSQPPPLSPEESYVKIGDRVKEITTPRTESVR